MKKKKDEITQHVTRSKLILTSIHLIYTRDASRRLQGTRANRRGREEEREIERKGRERKREKNIENSWKHFSLRSGQKNILEHYEKT